MTVSAYPLTWPPNFQRAKSRTAGQFKTTLAGALKNVEDSLRRFAVDSGKKIDALVMSSNVTLGMQRPADPGVAVWFSWDGLQVCIPVDRYNKVESNLQAIHHVIEARRTELRHGGLEIVRATFTGFKALPAPADGWRDVLGLTREAAVTVEMIERRYKTLARRTHPDVGGNDSDMSALNVARDEALRAIGS